MSDYKELHNEAMELAEKAIVEINKGNKDKALELNLKAFEKEKEVALASKMEPEPIRSILFRSAATLGFRCGNFEEAKNLTYLALSNNPPQDLKMELEELLQQINESLYKEFNPQNKKQMPKLEFEFRPEPKKNFGLLFYIESLRPVTAKKIDNIWQTEGDINASVYSAA